MPSTAAKLSASIGASAMARRVAAVLPPANLKSTLVPPLTEPLKSGLDRPFKR